LSSRNIEATFSYLVLVSKSHDIIVQSMSENQRSIDQKTLDRMAREWDRRVGKQKPFMLTARVSPVEDATEGDTIFIDDNPGREGRINPFNTQIIESSAMDDDLRLTEQKSLDRTTLDRLAREWDKGIKTKRPFSVTGKVYRTPVGTEQDIVIVRNDALFRGEQIIHQDEMDNDIKPTETSQILPQRRTPPQE
jgi:hypothetical protein